MAAEGDIRIDGKKLGQALVAATKAAEPRRQRRQRASHLDWIPVSEMRTLPEVQRKFDPALAERIAAKFDPEKLGFPVVNQRGGVWWVVDGQHRMAAMKIVGWADQSIQCECYKGLSDQEMAELFLGRDDRKAIRAFDKFRIAVKAGRPTETEIDVMIRAQGLKIAEGGGEATVGAITSCLTVFKRAGSVVLGQTLRVIRDAYGGDGAAFRADVIVGVGLVCQRYQGVLDCSEVAHKLSQGTHGVNGLRQKASVLKLQTGRPMSACIAGAVVDIYNQGKRTGRLESWWK